MEDVLDDDGDGGAAGVPEAAPAANFLRDGEEGGEVGDRLGRDLELVALVRAGNDGEEHGEDAGRAANGALVRVPEALEQVTNEGEVEVGWKRDQKFL